MSWSDRSWSDRSQHGSGVRSRGRAKAIPVTVAATLVIACACWVFAVRQTTDSAMGMNMGAASRLGSLGFFLGLWASMMAAMMLPGVLPAAVRRARVHAQVRAVPEFLAAYLLVWTLVGLVVYALYRPHGSAAAGAVVVAAGLYELTPIKRRFCRARDRSGFEFGLYCVGSSIGLMLILIAISVMSIAWMVVVTVLVVAQKLLPANAFVDLPLAVAIVGLGVLILVAPTSVPGLT